MEETKRGRPKGLAYGLDVSSGHPPQVSAFEEDLLKKKLQPGKEFFLGILSNPPHLRERRHAN